MGIRFSEGVIHFSTAPWLVFLMLFLVVMWLIFSSTFFMALRKYDLHSFTAMGEPTFSSGGALLSMMSYIYRRAHRKAGHLAFSVLCDVMCLWLPMIAALWCAHYFWGLGGPPVDI